MALWSGRFERDRTRREGRRCQDWDRRRGLKGCPSRPHPLRVHRRHEWNVEQRGDDGDWT